MQTAKHDHVTSSQALTVLSWSAIAVMSSLVVTLLSTRPAFGISDWTTSMEPVEFELADRKTGDKIKLRIPKAYLVNKANWSGGQHRIITVKVHLPDLEPWTVWRQKQSESKRQRTSKASGWDDTVYIRFTSGKDTTAALTNYVRRIQREYAPGEEKVEGLAHFRRHCYREEPSSQGEPVRREVRCATLNRDYFITVNPTPDDFIFLECIPKWLNEQGGCEAITSHRGWHLSYMFWRNDLQRWKELKAQVGQLFDLFAGSAGSHL